MLIHVIPHLEVHASLKTMNPHGNVSSGVSSKIPHGVITDDLIWSNVLLLGRYRPGLYEEKRINTNTVACASKHVWVIFARAFWCSLRVNYSCSAAHVCDPCRRCRVVVRDTTLSHIGPDDIKTQVVLVNHLMAWHQYPFHLICKYLCFFILEFKRCRSDLFSRRYITSKSEVILKRAKM